ncbi:MAG: protein kinase [Tepidisphaeraceae bacterium]
MAIRCPYCEHVIELAGVRPGKFHPRCPQCKGKFSLRVFDDPHIAPQVGVEEKSGSDATWTGRTTAHSIDPGATKAPVHHGHSKHAHESGHPTTAPRAASAPHQASELRATSAPVAAAKPQAASVTVAPTSATVTPVKSSDSMSGNRAIQNLTSAPPSSSDSVRGATAIPAGEQVFRTIAKQARPDEPELHGRLGGYEIVQKLGQGGMGSVYLARQLSLDRTVAIKTLAPHLAQDASFVARFSREAFAAAQLSHHNVVQIHDIGEDRGHYFFSMEFVEGQNLGHVVESEGKVEPGTAVGYILQAARGLKAAHDLGMIHRDVKPENMMLNDQGIVKVADLGLVKRKGDKELTDVGDAKPQTTSDAPHQTHINTSMGTPAYIAPEQAMDAAHVDQRADIYSLGCTLYDLITGRPPFSGRTAEEVITKHLRDPVPPPERIVKNLSPALSGIIQKMVAKKPEDRYQTMAEVIKELERYLGVDGGNVRASSDKVKIVEYAVERFNASPAAKLRANVIVAFLTLCVVAAVLCFVTGFLKTCGAMVAIAVLSTLAYQFTIGITQKTPLFAKVRQFLFGASVMDWLKVIVIAVLTGWLLLVFDQLWVWLGVAVIAAGLGFVFHIVFDGIVMRQREKPLNDAELLIKDLRVKGQDEDQIRGFIAKFSGNDWEAFYEALFGYESKLWARALYGIGERGKRRKKFAAWRDTLIGFIDRRIEARKQAKERKLLEKLEAKAMIAKGIQSNIAAKQAKASASKLVDKAAYMKQSIEKRRMAETLAPASKTTAPPKKSKRAQEMLEAAEQVKVESPESEISESLEGWERQSYLKRRVGGPLDVLFGKMTRFTLAALVLIGFAMWWNQNKKAAVAAELTAMQGQSIDPTKIDIKTGVAKVQQGLGAFNAGKNEPLHVPGVPQKLADAVGSWPGLIAGLVLLAGVFFEGKKMTVATWLGAFVALFGAGFVAGYVPALASVSSWVSSVTGAAIGFLGIFMLRRIVD